MSQPYIGEVRMFAITYAPRHWTDCSGQLLAVNQNQALFSLLGISFGGNGTTTFGLPDYRGRTPIGQGSFENNSYVRGNQGGNESVTLSVAQIPPHMHFFNAQNAPGNAPNPIPAGGTGSLCAISNASYYVAPDANLKQLASDAVTSTGNNVAHSNLQPSLVLRFAIALQGVFPSRN
ncbi:MAG TPA: tail fiber protein [Cellvibrio sp.]